MALAIGTKTNDLFSPAGASSRTIVHAQDTGANGLLTVYIGHSISSAGISGITYNGVALTQQYSDNTSITEMRQQAWQLQNPDTGSNNLVVTFSGAQFNPISTEIISFTGADQIIDKTFVNTGGPPTSGTITVAQNSVVVAVGIAGTAGTNITIDGSSRTIDWNNNANNYIFGGVSALGLSAGSIGVSVNSTAQVALMAYEISEAGGTPSITSKNTQVVWL